jgi:predicted nucleic acid-binding protein
LDACTLIPIRLTTALLWLAEAGLFDVLWSVTILDEVQRNLPKIGISPDHAGRRVATMRDALGAAALVDDFEHLIPEMTCDPKDRHVLAAAVRAGADTLVTFNITDFPLESVESYGIERLRKIDPVSRPATARSIARQVAGALAPARSCGPCRQPARPGARALRPDR